MAWTPYFPLSTSMFKYIGLDLTLIHPPLPAGASSQGELPSTERWCKVFPYQTSRRVCLGWVDMRQAAGQPYENFWPGVGKWTLGYRMDDAEMFFDVGERWDTSKKLL